MSLPPSPRCVVVNILKQVPLCGSPCLAMYVSLMLAVGCTCIYPIPDLQRKLKFAPLQGQVLLQCECVAVDNKCFDISGMWSVLRIWGDIGKMWKLWPCNKWLWAAWWKFPEVCQATGRDAEANIQKDGMLPFRSQVRRSTSKPVLNFLPRAGSLTVSVMSVCW